MVAPTGEGSSAPGPYSSATTESQEHPLRDRAPDDIVHSKDEKFDPLVVADVT